MDNKPFVSDSEPNTKEQPVLNNTYYSMDKNNEKTVVSVLKGWINNVVKFITTVPS
jgi:hypothetical protein